MKNCRMTEVLYTTEENKVTALLRWQMLKILGKSPMEQTHMQLEKKNNKSANQLNDVASTLYFTGCV
ncbi:hypothetical protein F2P81_011939 [Scophthalmus maximus]|uniref:Uncharacterized protein n=1 Tax=Scophthalmus maximus TaxID=52904 RepID=A0A6A4ST69_SCOMX|nr:hypothetical protein F2P81_011939 [Scophthalmus maximus]